MRSATHWCPPPRAIVVALVLDAVLIGLAIAVFRLMGLL